MKNTVNTGRQGRHRQSGIFVSLCVALAALLLIPAAGFATDSDLVMVKPTYVPLDPVLQPLDPVLQPLDPIIPPGGIQLYIPNLTVTTSNDFSFTPTTVKPGDTISFTGTFYINNEGTADATDFYWNIYISTDSVIDSGDTSLFGNYVLFKSTTVAAGASESYSTTATLTIPAGTAPGTYYVGILADSTGNVSESSETDNYYAQQITVKADKPDLVISTTPAATPSTVEPGGTVALSGFTVKNQGDASAGASNVGIYLSADASLGAFDLLLDTKPVGALSAGQQTSLGGTTLTIPADQPDGTYYIILEADTDNTVSESDGLNNTTMVTITVASAPASAPDLVILSAPTVTPTDVSAGDTVTLGAFTVKNQGNENAGASTVGIYISSDSTITAGDTLLDTAAVGALSAGAQTSVGSTVLTIPAGTSSGWHYIGVLADNDNAVAESNEGNNHQGRQINVVDAGQFTMTVTVHGAGTVTSNPAGINCTSTTGATNTCTASFGSGVPVWLTADEDDTTTPPHVFDGWSGDCTGTAVTCLNTMDANHAVTATFSNGQGMAVPNGVHAWSYPPVETPVLDVDPENCKPLGLGDLDHGKLEILAGLQAMAGDVDIYIGVAAPGLIPDDMILFTPSGTALLSDGLVPWMEDAGATAIDESLFGGLSVALASLPSGTYTVYMAITPANDLSLTNLYLWATYFVVP